MRIGVTGTVLLLVASTGLAAAQSSSSSSFSPQSAHVNRMVQSASKWDANGDAIYTCEEWKAHVTKIFNAADKNRDGFVDAQEFKAIRDADVQFKEAELGYFDDNRDGKLNRAEFIDKPSQFFLRFDRDKDCKVTMDEISNVSAPPRTGPVEPPRGSGRLR